MRNLLLGTLTLALLGCGSSGPTAPAPGERVAFGGGSVTMPAGGGWRLVERKPDVLTFERALADDGHVLIAMAQLFPYEFADLEECRSSLHRDSYIETPTHREPRGSVELIGDAEPPYVRVRYSAREADTAGQDAKWTVLSTEFRWLLRPGDNRGVMLSFAERRPQVVPAADYAGQSGLFFASFRHARVPPDDR